MKYLPLVAAALALPACTSDPRNGTEIGFDRPQPSAGHVSLELRWKSAREPSLYTPRGEMTKVLVREGGSQASVPEAEISSIEDIRLEEIRIASSKTGDYDILIPFGVGEGSAETFLIRNFQFVGNGPPPNQRAKFLTRKPD